MTNVIRFPGHLRTRCSGEDCNGMCNYCTLFHCAVCHGAEASLPAHCPGERMTTLQEMCVQDGSLDYVDGAWHFKGWSNKGHVI